MAISRRQFLVAAAATGVPVAAAPPRPTIVLLLLDDLGWRDFGCYGNTFFETQHLDRLASEGIRFTNAYAACPVCSPTRVSIMTGKYPVRLHLTDWIPGRKQWPTAKLIAPAFEQHLPLREATIAEALKPLGYRTASIGKWQLGGDGFLPTDQGFDWKVAGTERGSPQSYFGPFDLPNLKGGTKDDYITEKLSDMPGPTSGPGASGNGIWTAAPAGIRAAWYTPAWIRILGSQWCSHWHFNTHHVTGRGDASTSEA